MNFLKKLFNTKSNNYSNLEVLMNLDLQTKEDEEKVNLYLQVIEDLKEGKSEVYLAGKDVNIETTFFKNTVIVGQERYAVAFTNESEIAKWNKIDKEVTRLSSFEFLGLCVHFNLSHVVLNIKSENRYFFEFKIPKPKKISHRYDELCQIGVDAYLSELEDINWFAQESFDKSEIKKRLSTYEGTNEFVFALTHVEFDSEAFEDINDYQNHLNTLLTFIPEAKLKIINDGRSYVLELRIGKQYFTHKLQITKGGYEEGILNEFINPALNSIGNDYRFYTLPTIDQIIRLTYAASINYYAAQDKGLIPDEDHFM